MIDLNQPHIIENLLPSHYVEHLYKTFTQNSVWNLNSLFANTSFNNSIIKDSHISPTNKIYNNIHDGFQFQDHTLASPKTPLGNPAPFYLLHYLQIYLNYQFEIIPQRIKTNLQTPLPFIKKGFHNTPHIDLRHTSILHSYYTLIYYVNDSDGDTIIYNEKYNLTPIENFTINKKITPKKGLAVLFPYNTFHSGSHPVSSKARIVINYNFQLIPL